MNKCICNHANPETDCYPKTRCACPIHSKHLMYNMNQEIKTRLEYALTSGENLEYAVNSMVEYVKEECQKAYKEGLSAQVSVVGSNFMKLEIDKAIQARDTQLLEEVKKIIDNLKWSPDFSVGLVTENTPQSTVIRESWKTGYNSCLTDVEERITNLFNKQ